jgi:hypothetical protein
MWEKIIIALLPLGLVIAACGLFTALIEGWKWLQRRERRRAPFCQDFLREPGHSLRVAFDDISVDFHLYLCALAYSPLILFLFGWLYRDAKILTGRVELATYIVFCLVLLSVLSRKIVRTMEQRKRCQLGLEGEIATAQELMPVIRKGYWVFHDIPMDGPANIDHVVVGPSGVYALETKARRKPTNRKEKDSAKVVFDGQLRFPGWDESKPLEQARGQAEWLTKWIWKAAGEDVKAKPILVLPGWFIERTKPSTVFIINPKNLEKVLAPANPREPLSEETIRRIVHQLDQRCRDVVPGFRSSEPDKPESVFTGK